MTSLSDEATETLLAAARANAERAYVPYSSFRVGAAVLTADGATVAGCNIENASYGLACCGERTAMFAARAAGHTDLVALAVSCVDGDVEQPATLMPCGACRQVMVELLRPDAVVIVDGVGTLALDDLLPNAFRLD
ncbi:MAG: cytidine deaminase [Acidimicrobiales bacterium]